jgi:hypothetical protein
MAHALGHPFYLLDAEIDSDTDTDSAQHHEAICQPSEWNAVPPDDSNDTGS